MLFWRDWVCIQINGGRFCTICVQSEVMEAREKGHQAHVAEAEARRENKHLKDQVNSNGNIPVLFCFLVYLCVCSLFYLRI